MYSKLRPWCEWFTINEPAPPIAHHGTLDIRVYFSLACYLLNVCVWFGLDHVQGIRLCGERMHLLTLERERGKKERTGLRKKCLFPYRTNINFAYKK